MPQNTTGTAADVPTEGTRVTTGVNTQGADTNTAPTTADVSGPTDTGETDTAPYVSVAATDKSAVDTEMTKTDDAGARLIDKINKTRKGTTAAKNADTDPVTEETAAFANDQNMTRTDVKLSETAGADRPRVGRPTVDKAISVKQPRGPRPAISPVTATAADATKTSGTYLAADKLIEQRRLNGETWYLVRWTRGSDNQGYPDSWSKAADVTKELKTQFYEKHTKNGTLRAEFRRKLIKPRPTRSRHN